MAAPASPASGASTSSPDDRAPGPHHPRVPDPRRAPRPRRRGRVGIYGPSHLARLELIGRLQARGYSLAGIRDLLGAWRDGADLGEVLGLAPDQLVHLDEPGVPATLDQLATPAPTLVPDRLDDLVATGAVEACGPERYCIPSPSLLQLAVDARGAGYSPGQVLALLQTIGQAAGTVADATIALLGDPPPARTATGSSPWPNAGAACSPTAPAGSPCTPSAAGSASRTRTPSPPSCADASQVRLGETVLDIGSGRAARRRLPGRRAGGGRGHPHPPTHHGAPSAGRASRARTRRRRRRAGRGRGRGAWSSPGSRGSVRWRR